MNKHLNNLEQLSLLSNDITKNNLFEIDNNLEPVIVQVESLD